MYLRNDEIVFGHATVDKVAKAGGQVMTLAMNAAVFDMVADNSDVFFKNSGSVVRKVAIAGGPPNDNFASSINMRYLGLDSTYLYFSESNLDGVRRINKTTGTGTTTLFDLYYQNIRNIVSNDAIAAWVIPSSRIDICNAGGCNGPGPTTLKSSVNVRDLQLQGNILFFNNMNGTNSLYKAPIDNSATATVLATSQGIVDTDVVFPFGTDLYFSANHALRKVPQSGSVAPTTILTAPAVIRAIIVETGFVYLWLDTPYNAIYRTAL
jgi:hypothetical protein